jgi:competence protein ComGC
MIDAYKKGQQAGVIANLDAVKKTVEAYHASNDKYPQSLADLKDLIGSDIDLAQYDYNPENGTVSLKK